MIALQLQHYMLSNAIHARDYVLSEYVRKENVRLTAIAIIDSVNLLHIFLNLSNRTYSPYTPYPAKHRIFGSIGWVSKISHSTHRITDSIQSVLSGYKQLITSPLGYELTVPDSISCYPSIEL